MSVIFSENTKEFHLFNDEISYILKVMPNGEIGNLYYGKRIHHKNDFSYLLEGKKRSLAVYTKENDFFFSPQYSRMEYPAAGTGDFRNPAYIVKQENGSRITNYRYVTHRIYLGKEPLENLPAVYVEQDKEAESLEIILEDELIESKIILKYSIYRDYPVITRSVKFDNCGKQKLILEKAYSASVDLPDAEYEMIQLSGAWARERRVIKRKLQQGMQSIGSTRGSSSAEQNPFIAVKRVNTDENQGEVYGFSLIYSGNHIENAEVDTCNTTRIQIGIHEQEFEWPLYGGDSFQTPEAVLVYSDQGINKMSQTYHSLFRKRLVRGFWRDKERPVLINNWEATGADFDENKILKLAEEAKKVGIELFVLDDGWFGNRDDDTKGLGDWYVKDTNKLPGGISSIASKITALGMKFGLWFEPEMVNRDSDLFREHPDWILCPPGRTPSPSRSQYVLDFSREEVVNHIGNMMEKILEDSNISYVKWDMNRYLTECYSLTAESENQGMVMHRYILGVYQLYDRLIKRFPEILFESCSSGGARFDPGMLYYAPQTWTSDDTDAMERVKIQYGTSLVYPLSAMGAHVSDVPNQQVGRVTPFETRGNVAMFGMLGYELDLNHLKQEELDMISSQVAEYKKNRKLIMEGSFYRLQSPFEENDSAWIVVSDSREEALVGFYRCNGVPNGSFIRLKICGLDPDKKYSINEGKEFFWGNELMNAGVVIHEEKMVNNGGDFSSLVFKLKACKAI